MARLTNGFIVLSRKLLDWEWYQDSATTCLWIHCLLSANWEDVKWRGIVIERGSFVTSLPHLAEETGLSIKQVRRALDNLENSGCLGRQRTNKYTLIKVLKYCEYQDLPDEYLEKKGRQKADKGQTEVMSEGRQRADKGQQLNNINKNKQYKQYNNNILPTSDSENPTLGIDSGSTVEVEVLDSKSKHKYGEYKHVLLTEEQHAKLHQDYDNADELIKYLDEYIEMKGYKAKNHNLAIRKWVVDAVKKNNPQMSNAEKVRTGRRAF